MSPVIGAAADLQSYCQTQGWQFCFIGGIAVQRVMEVQEGKLHIGHIFEELRPLAALKENDSIITRLERMMKKQGLL